MLGNGVARTLSAIGRRLLTDRRGRVALTVAGVVLGVALFTGSLLTTTTASQGFEEFARETSGQADVLATSPGGSLRSIVSPRGGELDETIVDELLALPGVDRAEPLLITPSAFVGPEGRTEQRINFRVAAALVGADLSLDEPLYPVEVAEGRLPVEDADELALPVKVADDLGASVGTTILVSTPEGDVPITLVGTLAPSGLGGLDRVGFSSLATVRRLSGQPGAVTQIALALDHGIAIASWLDQTTPPEGIALTSASDALHVYRVQLNALNGALTVLGLGLLMTAGFLIYLTLAMSVAERTRLYGTLRALGATRRQVRRVVYAEAFGIGVLGTAVGLVLGVAVAAALHAATARLMSLFGGPELVFTPWAFVVGAVVGVGVSLASAMVPARRAARIDPAAAIRDTAADAPASTGKRVVAIALTVVGLLALTRPGLTAVSIGMLLLGVGSVRLVPLVIGPVSRLLAPLMGRLSRVGGRVAVQHLMAERTRSAYTLALVMLVMALTVAILAIWTSFTTSLDRQITAQLAGSLTVESASHFEPSFVDALGDVPGVAATTARSGATSAYTPPEGPDEDILVSAIDPSTYFDVGSFRYTDGTEADAVAALADPRSVMIPTATAARHDIHRGDQLTLYTLEGPQPFTVAVIAELTNVPAEFIVGKAAAPAFAATAIEDVLVRVDDGADQEVVRDRIEESLGNQARFMVVTSEEYRADTRAQIGGGVNAFFLLLGLAAIVGTFGLANTMAVAVTQRYREIGVLRAIGARRRHIRAMAIVESITLVAIALVLALPLGLVLSGPLLEASRSQIGDLTVDYRMPWLVVPIVGVVAALVAVGAAVWPAQRAAEIEIDTALRFE